MERTRHLEEPIGRDLQEKMVFLAGPRQVGKTTLAKQILRSTPSGVYLNWDRREDRKIIRLPEWPAEKALVVLDEFHKSRGWKRWIKGEYDHHKGHLSFLVTGSARMDIYRRGGDSLQGRYHHYRLHPFSALESEGIFLKELWHPGEEIQIPPGGSKEATALLMRFGGFPEPLLAQSERKLRRWQKERLDRFFREDVRDLEIVRELSSLQLLADMLMERVASPMSLNSLREDLEVSHRAVNSWIDLLERLYFLFRLRPFTVKSIRGIKKMAKTYLWDSSLVQERGARFENLVALHLLKFCHFLEDTEGYRVHLHYLREARGREVDFLVVHDRKPWFAVEAKLTDERIDSSLEYFRKRLEIPWTYQVVLDGQRDFVHEGIRCLPAHRFFGALV